jgi:hypothetical protein
MSSSAFHGFEGDPVGGKRCIFNIFEFAPTKVLQAVCLLSTTAAQNLLSGFVLKCDIQQSHFCRGLYNTG